jgi:hypothetical protein
VLGVDLSEDQHVFFAENTTDAVLMAVTQFRRDTVMFNNDLQDGGSPKAIAAFQAHHKQYGFTLSGRSLNRDAPQVLKDFIKKAGGDFKVNPINREVGAAINWRPMDLVFVLDEGDGMAEAAGKIKEIWLKIAKSLKSQGMDCRFAVLPCRAKSDQIPRIPLTSDVAELERQLTEAKPSDSGEAQVETDTLQALEDVLKLDFRKDASPIVFLITNSSVKDKDRLAELAKTFNDREIETIIQANASDQGRFRPLYSQRGQFYTMAGEKKTERKPEKSDLKTKSQNVDFDDILSTLGQDSSEEPILQGIFSLRTAGNRQRMIQRLGGTPQSEQAVAAGLDWLARHQADDGHWSDHAKCDKDSPCRALVFGPPTRRPTSSTGQPLAETGMAILAYQAGGHYYFNKAKYSDNVKRGLDWIVQE